jgi:DNA-binding NarL/FixJ family response regulator
MTLTTVHDSPITVALVDDSDLSVAGLGVLLAPYSSRVRLVDTRTALAHPEQLDVILYEPVHQSSMSQALLRDLTRTAQARAAVFSWVQPAELPAANPHLCKTLTASQLVVAMEKLAAEQPELPDEVVDEVTMTAQAQAAEAAEEPADLRSRREPVALGHEVGLTPREADIVARIVAGLSNREISEELVLSVNSVKTYIRSAYRKMGVDRRTQAVLWGLEHGFGESHDPALVG